MIIASGLMAGGALGGVFGAACRLIPGFTEDWIKTPFYDNDPVSQIVSAAVVRRALRLPVVRLVEPAEGGGAMTLIPRWSATRFWASTRCGAAT